MMVARSVGLGGMCSRGCWLPISTSERGSSRTPAPRGPQVPHHSANAITVHEHEGGVPRGHKHAHRHKAAPMAKGDCSPLDSTLLISQARVSGTERQYYYSTILYSPYLRPPPGACARRRGSACRRP